MAGKTLILDNGGHSIKAGFAPNNVDSNHGDVLKACSIIPNCIVRTLDRKTYIAAQTAEITRWSEAVFRRPVENGQLVNWEVQKEIWDQTFFDERTIHKNCYVSDAVDTTLILGEVINALPALQKNTDEVVMEEYGYGAYLRVPSPTLNTFNNLHPLFESTEALKADYEVGKAPMECLLAVDIGFSLTTIVPIYNGKPISRAVRHFDLAGKQLTSLLQETLSLRRDFDLRQDVKIVNDIKEDTCFVSSSVKDDLERTWAGNKKQQGLKNQTSEIDHSLVNKIEDDLRMDYVLPDGASLIRGFARPHDPSAAAMKKRRLAMGTSADNETFMTIGNERFMVPEVLFTPSDIGSKQPGLTDCVMQSLTKLPPLIQATMLANVILVGGTAKMPGLVDRLESELRSKVKTEWPVRVRKLGDPTTSSWLGGARLAADNTSILKERAITKEQYAEYGANWMNRRFAGLPR